MKTTRTVDHGNGHIDTETLFIDSGGEIWAVTECNCELSTSNYVLKETDLKSEVDYLSQIIDAILAETS